MDYVRRLESEADEDWRMPFEAILKKEESRQKIVGHVWEELTLRGNGNPLFYDNLGYDFQEIFSQLRFQRMNGRMTYDLSVFMQHKFLQRDDIFWLIEILSGHAENARETVRLLRRVHALVFHQDDHIFDPR